MSPAPAGFGARSGTPFGARAIRADRRFGVCQVGLGMPWIPINASWISAVIDCQPYSGLFPRGGS